MDRGLAAIVSAHHLADDRPIAVGRTAEIYPWRDGWVLKLYRPGWSADAAEHEAKVTRTAYEAGLPAPRVREIVEVDGRVGLELERVDGPSLLANLLRRPWTVDRSARLVARLHAEMHEQIAPAFPSLRDRLDRRIRAVQFPPEVEAALLGRLAKLPEGDLICHGDFHPDNVLLTTRGPVIIDWIDASRGPAAADVARTLLLTSIGAPPGLLVRSLIDVFRTRFRVLYMREYLRLRPQSAELIEAWVPVIAAARWREGIQGEQRALEGMIQSGFRAGV